MTTPERFKTSSISKVPLEVKSILTTALKSKQGGIYITGRVGIGKTYICYAIKNYLEENGYPVILKNIPDLIGEWKIAIAQNKYSEQDIYDIAEFDGLVILDDIGTEKITDFVYESLYKLINTRYENMKPIIFTSNLEHKQLSERLGDRITSRIIGMTKLIKLTGEDKRL